jgi:hypothetical protein
MFFALDILLLLLLLFLIDLIPHVRENKWYLSPQSVISLTMISSSIIYYMTE